MSYDNMSLMEIDYIYQNESNDDDMSVTDVEIEEEINTEIVNNEELPEEVKKY